MDFNFKVYKKHGHKWLLPIFRGSNLSEICIDSWFTSNHPDSVTCVTVSGFRSLSQFTFTVDSVGNYLLHLPTCFGFHSKRSGLRCTGDSHSYVLIRPSFLESVLSEYIGF